MTTRRQAELDPGFWGYGGFMDQLIYRWPHVLGPPFVAGLGFGLAFLANWWGDWAPWTLTAFIAIVVFLGIEPIPRLPGWRERLYARACWYLGGTWVVTAGWIGPFWTPGWTALGVPLMVTAWGALLTCLWPPWFTHRRIRRGVQVAPEILAWDGDSVGLPNVDLSRSSAGADEDGWWATFKGVKGRHTLQSLRGRIPNIASWYDAELADVQIDKKSGDKEGTYVLRVRQTPRPKGGSVYHVPEDRPTLRAPFPVGDQSRDKTQSALMEVWRHAHGGVHGLYAGQTGFGKTNLMRRIALQAVTSSDGLLFIGDMKPGSPDYRHIGSRGAYVYARTAAEIDAMVRALLVILRVRGERPRPDRMVLPVLLDETSLYYNPTDTADDTIKAKNAASRVDTARLAKMKTLVSTSRGYDVSVHAATQKAKDAMLGEMRSFLLAGQAVGFYSPKAADSQLISNDRSFTLENLPKGTKGEVLMQNLIHEEFLRASLHHVTDKAERLALDRFADDQGGLHQDELDALYEELGDEWDMLRKANRDVRPALHAVIAAPAAEPEPESQPRRTNRAESQQLVWDALAKFKTPALARDVAEAVGKSERIVRIRLNELVEDGRATKQGQARWIKYAAVAAAPNGGTG